MTELFAAVARPEVDVEAAAREVAALARTGRLRHASIRAVAAQVLERSADRTNVALAHELALQAFAVPAARAVAARSFDRMRVLDGMPQKFGTQRGPDGCEWPVDPATTDSERAKWGLPPLQELRGRSGG